MELNKQLGLEAIAYIANRLEQPSYFYIGKALYYADKWSLEHFGRTVYWDTYIAMDNGPVPSFAYDAMKSANGDVNSLSAKERRDVKQLLLASIEQGRVYIRPKRDADLDELSESDVQALEYGLAEVKGLSFGELSDKSHDSAWCNTPTNRAMSYLDIAQTLKNGEAVAQHLEAFY